MSLEFDKLFDGVDKEKTEGVLTFLFDKEAVTVRTLGKVPKGAAYNTAITLLANLVAEQTGRTVQTEQKWIRDKLARRIKKRKWFKR